MKNSIFILSSMFVACMTVSMEEERKIIIFNQNVPGLSIKYFMLSYQHAGCKKEEHKLFEGEGAEFTFINIEFTKNPKLIIENENISTRLPIPKFDTFADKKCRMCVTQQDDSITVTTKKDDVLIDLLFMACGASLSSSR